MTEQPESAEEPMDDGDELRGRLIHELETLGNSCTVTKPPSVGQEDRYRLLADATPNLAWGCEAGGKVLYCNQRWHEYTGQTPEESRDYGWMDAVHPDDLLPLVQRMVASGGTYEAEFRLRRGTDGAYRWHLARSVPVQAEDDAAISWFASAVDIEDRKLAELALAEAREESEQKVAQRTAILSETIKELRKEIADRRWAEQALQDTRDQLQYLLSGIPAVVYSARPSGLYAATFISETVRDLLGYEPAEFLDDPAFWAKNIHADDAPRVFAGLSTLLERNRLACEYRFRHKNGAYLWMRAEMRLIRDARGEPVEVLGYFADVSDRKQAEDRLRASNATLAERTTQLRALAAELNQTEQRERRRLAQVLHDQLQQILVAARMKAAAVSKQFGDARARQGMAEVDRLLEQCLGESRSLALELSPPVLYEAGLSAALEWLAERFKDRHSLNVVVDADPDANPVDESLRLFLFSAARELLLNVVKHARVGQALLRFHATSEQTLRLEVHDEGVGMAAEAGLPGRASFGLFWIRERLDLLGGRLETESRPGGGTRATVLVPRPCLPRAAVQAPAAPEPHAPHATRATGPIRVLVADDHPILRKGLADLLSQQAEIEVVGEAKDGEEAVRLAWQVRPDVVLMDVTMPRLNGIEATRRITTDLPGIRVVGLSMHEGEEIATAMRDAGAAAYLHKGDPCEEFLAAISGTR